MRTLLLGTCLALLISPAALGQMIVHESWEGDYTLLGMQGSGSPPILAEAVADAPIDPMHGLQVLQLIHNSPGDTPVGFLAWVRDLQPGDWVTASFWRYTETGGREAACQIWAHWNDDPDDLYGYHGDAGGNEEFGTGGEWDQTEWSWFVPYGTNHTGLVIEARLHSEAGDTVWIDYMTVEAPSHSLIELPGDMTPAAETSWGEIKALFQ